MRVAASADLIDDREYAAPPELVFEAWTNAEHFARWFAPDNVEVPDGECDDARVAVGAHIVRHRKLAAIGWRQTAERLVAYLERRTPWAS